MKITRIMFFNLVIWGSILFGTVATMIFGASTNIARETFAKGFILIWIGVSGFAYFYLKNNKLFYVKKQNKDLHDVANVWRV